MRSTSTLYLSLALATAMLVTATFSESWWIWVPATVIGASAAVVGVLELRKPSDQHGPPGQH